MASSAALLSRIRIFLYGWIILLSIVQVGFAIIYEQDLSAEPLRGSDQLNQTLLNVYLLPVPIVSIFHAILELFVLAISRQFRPTFTLVVTVIISIGWLIQACFWMDCEVLVQDNEHIPSFCPQSPLRSQRIDQYGPEAIAKNVLIWVVFMSYLVQICYASAAVHHDLKNSEHERDSEGTVESLDGTPKPGPAVFVEECIFDEKKGMQQGNRSV